MIPEILVVVARLLLASILLMAGVLKLREGAGLADTISKFRILPQRLARPVAKILPVFEVTLALCLYSGFFLTGAAFIGAGLVAIFVAASIWAIVKHYSIQCNCFGLLYREAIEPATVGRDAILLVGFLGIGTLDRGYYSLVEAVGNGRNSQVILALGILTIPLLLSVSLVILALNRSQSHGDVPYFRTDSLNGMEQA
jgi:uncharacterized membrane protein YphA (DoxX/SURF4 family)